MKYTCKIAITLLCISLAVTEGPTKTNPYKEDKKVTHSLYREKDSVERMSNFPHDIPLPIDE